MTGIITESWKKPDKSYLQQALEESAKYLKETYDDKKIPYLKKIRRKIGKRNRNSDRKKEKGTRQIN